MLLPSKPPENNIYQKPNKTCKGGRSQSTIPKEPSFAGGCVLWRWAPPTQPPKIAYPKPNKTCRGGRPQSTIPKEPSSAEGYVLWRWAPPTQPPKTNMLILSEIQNKNMLLPSKIPKKTCYYYQDQRIICCVCSSEDQSAIQSER